MSFYSLILPALIIAAEGEEKVSFLTNQPLWRVLNLLIFVAIIVYLLRNKIKIGDVLNNRASSIAKKLEQARREKQEALERLSQLESRLKNLDQELEQIRAEATAQSNREAERIQKAAAADAEKIRVIARQEIEGSLKAARNDLRAFVAEQSVALAEGIIRRELGPEDNRRIIDKYVDGLGEARK